MCRRGELSGIKRDGRWFVDRKDLERYARGLAAPSRRKTIPQGTNAPRVVLRERAAGFTIRRIRSSQSDAIFTLRRLAKRPRVSRFWHHRWRNALATTMLTVLTAAAGYAAWNPDRLWLPPLTSPQWTVPTATVLSSPLPEQKSLLPSVRREEQDGNRRVLWTRTISPIEPSPALLPSAAASSIRPRPTRRPDRQDANTASGRMIPVRARSAAPTTDASLWKILLDEYLSDAAVRERLRGPKGDSGPSGASSVISVPFMGSVGNATVLSAQELSSERLTTGNAIIGGELTARRMARFESGLEVAGNAIVTGNLTVTGTLSGIVSGTIAGDVSGTLAAASVDKLKGVSLSVTGLATNNLLRYDGTNWVNGTASDLGSITLATGTSGTNVNVSGSPATLGGTITLNIPDAGSGARGVVTTGSQTFAGNKTFSGNVTFGSAVNLGDDLADVVRMNANQLDIVNGNTIIDLSNASQESLIIGDISTSQDMLAFDVLQNRVGVGTRLPSAFFSVGSSSQFQVNSTGAVIAATGLTSSGTVTFSGLTADRLVATTTGGTLTNSISSSNLALSLTDETGSGGAVFATSPTITTPTIATSATVPLLIGGTGTASPLTLRSTSGVGATGADIVFQTGNNGATEAMRILNGGNVGIGTTSPASALEVNGTVALTAASNAFRAGNFVSNHGGSVTNFTTADGGFYFSGGQQGAMNFVTNGQNRVKISQNGLVGIGTTAPDSYLHVVDPVGLFDLVKVAAFSGSTALHIDVNGAISMANNAFRINTSGAITASTGIMTTGAISAPTTTNTINGLIVNAGALSGVSTLVASTSITNPLLIGGTGTTSPLTLRSTSGVGSTGADIVFQTGNNGATEAMRILNSGNVGIGGSPTYKVDIFGASNSGIRLKQGSQLTNASGAFYSGLTFENVSTTHAWSIGYNSGGTLGIQHFDASSAYTNVAQFGSAGSTISTSTTTPILIGGTGTASPLTLRSTSGAGATGADIVFQTGNNGATEAMRILNSGNVGIGTNTPAFLLNVASASSPALALTDTNSSDYYRNIVISRENDNQVVNFSRSTGSAPSTFETFLHLNGANTNFISGRGIPANLTGGSNTFMGYQAGINTTDGSHNNFLGQQAGLANTTGHTNTFIGVNAGYNNQDGNRNTFIGESAGYSNVSGSYNNFIGNRTGNSNTGSYNVYVGTDAAYNATSGSNNIALGRSVTFPSLAGSQQLNIGNLIFGTGLYDGSGGTSSTPVSGNVGIGDNSPASMFTVGNGDLFQVNSSGAIVASTGIATTGAISAPTSTNTINGLVINSGALSGVTTLSAATSITNPLLIGGTGTASSLTLRSTSGVGASGADIVFQTGNNGATQAMRILNSGNKLIVGANNSLAANLYGINVDASSSHKYVAIGQDGTHSVQLGWNYDATVGNAVATLDTYGQANALKIDASSLLLQTVASGNVGIGTTSPNAKLSVAGVLAVGAGDGGTPVSATIRGPAATGNDVAGANLTFDASNGTGFGGSGAFVFRTASAGASNITLDASSTGGGSSATSFTWSHTTTSNSNRLLMLTVRRPFGDSSSPTSVTYGGQNLTLKRSMDDCINSCRFEIWYLVNPPSGSNNFSITYPTEATRNFGASTFYNVDQTTPLGTEVTSRDNSGTSASINVTTTSRQVVYDAIATCNATPTQGAGQSNLYSLTSGGCVTASSYKAATGTTTTMSWTFSNSFWAYIAVPINVAADASTNTLTERLRITPDGKIGVGATSPLELFTVGSSSQFQVNSAGAISTVSGITSTGNINANAGLDVDDAYVIADGGLTVAVPDNFWQGLGVSAGRVEFDDQTTDEVNILNANVGIGTQAPVYLLELKNAATTPNAPMLAITDPTNNRYAAGVGFNNATRMSFYAGETAGNGTPLGSAHERMVIKTDGSVGIGMTDPTNRLVVSADVTPASDYDSNGQLAIRGSTDTNKVLMLGVDTNAATSYAYIQSSLDGSAARGLSLNPLGGNIGIGTTNPGALLDLRGNLLFGAGDTVARTIQGPTDGELNINAGGSQILDFQNAAGGGVRLFADHGSGSELSLMITDYASSSNDQLTISHSGSIARIRTSSTADAIVLQESGGNVGIGTTTVGARLHVSGSETTSHGKGAGLTLANSASGGGNWHFRAGATGTTTPTGGLSIADDSEYRMTFDSTGNIGIGQTTPGVKLHIGSSAVTDSTNLLRLEDANSTCNFTADTGSPSCGSDLTLKKDVASLDPAEILSRVSRLNPVSYRWATDDPSAPLQYGFIAQEVEELFPQLVTTQTWVDGTPRKFLSTGNLVPYLAGASRALSQALVNTGIDPYGGVGSTVGPENDDALFDGIFEPFVSAYRVLSDRIRSGARITKEIVSQRVTAMLIAVEKLFAKSIESQEVCLVGEGGDKTCLSKERLDALLRASASTSSGSGAMIAP